MKMFKLAGIAAALIGLQGAAHAASFQALSGTGFTTETTSVVNQYLMPAAPAGSTISSYSVLSTASGFSTTGVVMFAAPVTSYQFLWGSPDSYNMVSDGKVSVTGTSLGGATTLYTFSDPLGFSTLTFTTSGIAFELAAVSPVPEPETYALLLGGLGVLGFVAARRRQ